MTTVTILFIHHEDPTPDAIVKASVWMIACANPKGYPGYPPESDIWTKVAGPIDQEIAEGIGDSLEEFFRQNGVNVRSEMIAD